MKNWKKKTEHSVGKEPEQVQKDYQSLFIDAASEQMTHRKCVYISEDYANLIGRLISVAQGSKPSIGGYINAVLEKHFETYKEDIRDFYDKNTRNPFTV